MDSIFDCGIHAAAVDAFVSFTGNRRRAHEAMWLTFDGATCSFGIVNPLTGREMSQDKRILIVENEQEHQDYIATILEVGGWPYEVASTALEAINLLRWFDPALVLLEIMMPRHEGLSVYRRMKHVAELREIPIIVVSWASELTGIDMGDNGGGPKNGHAHGSDVTRQPQPTCLQPEGFVGKPIDPSFLLNTVERILMCP